MASLIPTSNGNGSHDGEPVLTEFIRRTDEAEAIPRPTNIEKFYLEDEYEAAEDEQVKAYGRKGEADAREPDEKASSLDHEASRAVSSSDAKHFHATTARQRLEQAEAVLGPYCRRPTDAKWLKWGRWLLLLGGDLVGIAGASLLLGEEPQNAFIQAIATAASAVTLGAVGREVRFLSSARFRQKNPDELTEAEQQFASWFAGTNTAEALVKILVLTCMAGGLLIGAGIFELRYAAEGIEPAIAFSCFALALGLASFYNSFDTADDVAEHLDARAAGVKKIEKVAEKARRDPAIKDRAAAVSRATSARSEAKQAGEAAAAALRREMYAALGNSPGVAGNGTVSAAAAPPPSETEGSE